MTSMSLVFENTDKAREYFEDYMSKFLDSYIIEEKEITVKNESNSKIYLYECDADIIFVSQDIDKNKYLELLSRYGINRIFVV